MNAYRQMLVRAVSQGKITQRKAQRLFNQYLETQLRENKQ